MDENRKLMELLIKGAQEKRQPAAAAIPTFSGFEPTVELLTDYMDRFNTFAAENSIPEDRVAGVFLTNQQPTLYKQLSNMAAQLTTPKQINTLTMDEVQEFLKEQYDPKRFIVMERYKYWSYMQRKPGETIQELAARIRQDATTCAFTDIGPVGCSS